MHGRVIPGRHRTAMLLGALVPRRRDIALNNPQWKTAAAGVPALAIIRGPQAYISPSWYQSSREHGRTVPTWNYTTVHFTAPVRFRRDDDWLCDVGTRLTQRHEAGPTGRCSI